MTRILNHASLRKVGKLQAVGKGGTSSSNVSEIADNLKLVKNSTKNTPSGTLELDSSGKVSLSLLPKVIDGVDGRFELIVGQSQFFEVTDFDSFKNYTVSCLNGSVSLNNGQLQYVAPLIAGQDSIIINGRVLDIIVTEPKPARPRILAPVNGSSSIDAKYTLVSSPFEAIGGTYDHLSSDWQIATDPEFNNIIKQVKDDSVNKVNWYVTALPYATKLYARVRYKATHWTLSDWSDTVSFTIKEVFLFNDIISINTLNYNLKSRAIAAGWISTEPIVATITVNSGVVVGSSLITDPAFDTGAGFPEGSSFVLVNNGFIIGKGGNGGTSSSPNGTPGGLAFKAQNFINVMNNGTIGGGGGGGAKGADFFEIVILPGESGGSTAPVTNPGGAGGGGRGYMPGSPNGTISAPGPGYLGTIGTADTFAGLVYGSGPGGTGGNGGNLGRPGANGAGSGGAAGAAVNGNSFINWSVTGTRLGTVA